MYKIFNALALLFFSFEEEDYKNNDIENIRNDFKVLL